MSTPMFDVPEHFWLGVNEDGEGPVDYYEEAHRWVCWCGVPECEKPDGPRPGGAS